MIFDVDDEIAIKDDAKNGTFDALLFLQFILFLKISLMGLGCIVYRLSSTLNSIGIKYFCLFLPIEIKN